MKKKNPLLIALCALAALGALYWGLSSLKAGREAAKTEAEAERLAVMSFEGASEIAYNYGASDLTFNFTDSGWVCAEHANWPIDQNALETLEHDLGSLKAVRVLSEHGALADYGLDAPKYTVKITDANGGAHTLYLSANEDVNGNFYAALEGDGRLFTIAPSLADSLAKDLLEYVDYEPLPTLDENGVTALTLTQGGEVWEYTRAETAEGSGESETDTEGESEARYSWSCLKNGEPAEPVFENVESAIYDLAQLSFSSCAAYEPDGALKETFGLAEPHAELAVEYTEGGEAKSYSLTVGDSFGEGADSAYVMLGGSSAVTVCAYSGLSEAISLLRSA